MNKVDPMKVVLSVVDSEYPSDIRIEELVNKKELFESAVTIADRNGLYYYFIYKLKELNIALPFLDNDRWKEENQKVSKVKETVAFLNSATKNSAIDYILIKIFNTVPHVPNDIDIFIRKEERQKFIKVIENNGMDCVQSSPAETRFKGKYTKIDVYTEICYIGVDFIDGGFLWESKVGNEFFGVEYPALSEEADFLLLLPHYLFGHRRITLLDFLHMKHRISHINVNTCREYAYDKGWGTVFDLTLDHLNHLHERIYKEGEVIYFPYLFNHNFILKCISGIEGLNMGRYNKVFLYISFVMDKINLDLERTPLYNLVKSFEPARNLVNSFSALVKSLRGDKKSVDEEKNG